MTDWLRAATRPRLIGIFVLLILGALICIRLGAWQLDRAQIRGERAEEVRAAERANAEPVPIEDVLAPQTSMTQSMVGTRVSATGTFDVGEQFFVPSRPLDGRSGYLVLTGLRVSVGEGAGAILPVVRGWVPQADPAYLAALPEPDVDVAVMGYLAAPEQADSGAPPAGGQIEAITSAQLVNVWGGPMYSGHLLLVEQEPVSTVAAGLAGFEPLPAPVVEGGGLNLQNLAYAAEWWIFGGFALVLWWRMVRDEVRHLRAEASTDPSDPSTATSVPNPTAPTSS